MKRYGVENAHNDEIQEKIKKPAAEELLFGKLEKGGHIIVDEHNGEFFNLKLSILIFPV